MGQSSSVGGLSAAAQWEGPATPPEPGSALHGAVRPTDVQRSFRSVVEWLETCLSAKRRYGK